MKIKINKFKFTRKNSPKIKSDKKIHPHYSKIINSIFNQIKEKHKNINISKEKKENGIKINNINKKKFTLKNNKYKDLFITSTNSTIFNNNNININQKDNKKNINKKNNKTNNKISTKGNKSEKNIKIKILFDDNKINNDDNNQQKTINNVDTNIKKLFFKNNQDNTPVHTNVNSNNFKKITKLKKNQLISIPNNNDIKIYNKNSSYKKENYKKKINNNFSNKIKKIYMNDFNNSEIITKKNNKYKKIINKRNNDNNKIINRTPLNNTKYKNIFINNTNNNNNNNNNNCIIKNYDIKKMNLKNKTFCQKNKSNKILTINNNDNIKLNLSNSIIIESKRVRSLSKKRNEKKLLNIKQNELFTEKVNKKIYNLYSYMNEKKKDLIGNNSPSIKFIDIIRRNKKLYHSNLYVNNSD